jgi:hypothetical protein
VWDWTEYVDAMIHHENITVIKPYGLDAFFMLNLQPFAAPDCPKIDADDIADLYKHMQAAQRLQGESWAKPLYGSFKIGDVVNVKAGPNDVKKKNAISQWSAHGVIIEVGPMNKMLYRLQWFSYGLCKETAGEESKRMYHAGRLRPRDCAQDPARPPPLVERRPSSFVYKGKRRKPKFREVSDEDEDEPDNGIREEIVEPVKEGKNDIGYSDIMLGVLSPHSKKKKLAGGPRKQTQEVKSPPKPRKRKVKSPRKHTNKKAGVDPIETAFRTPPPTKRARKKKTNVPTYPITESVMGVFPVFLSPTHTYKH